MKYNILNSFSEIRLKNGTTKVKFQLSQFDKEEICEDLHLYRTVLNGKNVFVRFDNSKYQLCNPGHSINYLVFQYLKTQLEDNVGQISNYNAYANKLYEGNTKLSRQNMLDLCKYIELDQDEIHAILMDSDITYKKEFLRKELISKLLEWGFKKISGSFHNSTPLEDLYYKNIGENKYIIFSNKISMTKDISYVFDLWECSYLSERSIGKKEPISMINIILGFVLDRDYHLIKEYVESK